MWKDRALKAEEANRVLAGKLKDERNLVAQLTARNRELSASRERLSVRLREALGVVNDNRSKCGWVGTAGDELTEMLKARSESVKLTGKAE